MASNENDLSADVDPISLVETPCGSKSSNKEYLAQPYQDPHTEAESSFHWHLDLRE